MKKEKPITFEQKLEKEQPQKDAGQRLMIGDFVSAPIPKGTFYGILDAYIIDDDGETRWHIGGNKSYISSLIIKKIR